MGRNKLFIITILAISLSLGCSNNKLVENQTVTLTIHYKKDDFVLKNLIICGDSVNMFSARIGIPLKIIKSLKIDTIKTVTIEVGKDILVKAKPLDSYLSNPPNSNTIIVTKHYNQELYGEVFNSYYWLILLDNFDNKNELKLLKNKITYKKCSLLPSYGWKIVRD